VAGRDVDRIAEVGPGKVRNPQFLRVPYMHRGAVHGRIPGGDADGVGHL
jgi:hypothetical protein